MIHLVGLGPGDPERLPHQVFRLLTGGLPVYLRTARHPTVAAGPLADQISSLPVTPLDDEYENNPTFDDTYDAIVARLLRAEASQGEIVYAVPGHPLIGETTVERLITAAKAQGILYRVVGAPSFIDACLEAIGQAVTGDLAVVDALTLDPESPAPAESLRGGGPILLYQVHSRQAASDTKLSLMRAGYPDEFPVTLIQSAGVPGEETVRTVPLYEMDRGRADHLTSLWVPALPYAEDGAAGADGRRPTFYDLVRVMARLRNPEGGCPWDLKQTHTTLRKYVIEEAYEVAEAIDGGDTDSLRDELGDVLLQVVFHAQLATEEGTFEADDVCTAIVEKLVRRHPHVFGQVKVNGADEVLTNWEAIKAVEKAGRGEPKQESILDGIPTSLPALSAALEVSKRAVRAGFEWPDVSGVLDKVEEEFQELRAEVEAGTATDPQRVSAELGDLLFTLVNVGRKLGADPETALRGQLDRFKRRFRHIETQAAASGRALESLTLDEMEGFWQEAKVAEKAGRNKGTSGEGPT